MKHQAYHRIGALAVGALLSVAAGALAQTVPAAGVPDGALVIAGDVSKPLTLRAADLNSMPRVTVLVEQQGGQARYEGVLAGEILKRAGARLGRDLSGKAYVRASRHSRTAAPHRTPGQTRLAVRPHAAADRSRPAREVKR